MLKPTKKKSFHPSMQFATNVAATLSIEVMLKILH